jgi:hypothetical protein
LAVRLNFMRLPMYAPCAGASSVAKSLYNDHTREMNRIGLVLQKDAERY